MYEIPENPAARAWLASVGKALASTLAGVFVPLQQAAIANEASIGHFKTAGDRCGKRAPP